jgi:hypothetical protein
MRELVLVNGNKKFRQQESSNPDRGKKQIVIKDLKLLFLFQGNELMRFLFV